MEDNKIVNLNGEVFDLEEEDLSPMKVYGPGRIYAETSYRLLRGSTDAAPTSVS